MEVEYNLCLKVLLLQFSTYFILALRNLEKLELNSNFFKFIKFIQ